MVKSYTNVLIDLFTILKTLQFIKVYSDHKMCFVKLIIVQTLFLIAVSKQFWNFIPSDKFQTNNESSKLDMKSFIPYENSHQISNKYCLKIFSIKYDHDKYTEYTQYTPMCNECTKDAPNHTFYENVTFATDCPLLGRIRKIKYFRNYDDRDVLILVSLDGCYKNDETLGNITGTLLMTNDISFDYTHLLSLNYVWTQTRSQQGDTCSTLCKNVILERCKIVVDEKMYPAKIMKRIKQDYKLYYVPLSPPMNYPFYFYILAINLFVLVVMLVIAYVYYIES